MDCFKSCQHMTIVGKLQSTDLLLKLAENAKNMKIFDQALPGSALRYFFVFWPKEYFLLTTEKKYSVAIPQNQFLGAQLVEKYF